jgi:hypothetical protein
LEKLTAAEERALAATELAVFPIQLYEVRRTVKAILDLFGRNNFFAEYNAALQSSTISVFAKYDNENGFFGLTSYLTYADKQLKYAFSCAQKAKAQTANKLELSLEWCR